MNTASAAANSNNPRPRSASEEPRAQRTWIAVLAAAIAGVLLLLITPFPRGFQGETTGDAALVSQVENALDSGHWHHVAAAKIHGDDVTWGGVGADDDSEFEIGSITKTITAALFADAIERGKIDEETNLGEVWPELDGEVAEVTLASIATQRSGLPAQEPSLSFGDGLATFLSSYIHTDPYRGTATDLVDSLKDVDVGEQEPEYSNFAFGILGQALATVTDSSYGDLVRDRITEPLGMTDTYVPGSAEGLSHGYTASGLPAAPLTLGGTAPSGAIRSTAHDMSIWLRATMDGSAPGATSIQPREDYNESDRIGWAWLTTKDRSPNLTWHNGGTGGYRSFLGFDPKTSQGIIVLAESAISVDDAADVISTSEASVATRHSAQVHGDQAGAHS
ncbi:serine hydrolase domain-containing protein [Brevibacterium aurantiacum]|uniref:CubicO group peptidase, beta-lactamase class C family n=1 Tax=Brevibacterium aurantiacum TaxID=273384 RepID=A0A2H1K4X4_BREAU|nr:serine hydrolase domain-containing protein [Brevibacterium aurantiacum]GEB21786.1 serine hydrolase [Brevibacterium aurantiacum]SMX94780.1 CubicO group peptidase, beta-lactamase class C family [Brevibacterium aurantiacum]